MATITSPTPARQKSVHHGGSTGGSLNAMLGDRHTPECLTFWEDENSFFSICQRPRRLKSLKGVIGASVDEPEYLKKHPPATYTFVGLAPREGNYTAKSLVKIPEPGFERSFKGMSCGEALLSKPPFHWESSRPSKSLFMPIRSTRYTVSPRKSQYTSKMDSGFRDNASTYTYATSKTDKCSFITVGQASYKSRDNASSHFKGPRTTPVTTVTPISITLDINLIRKDSIGEVP